MQEFPASGSRGSSGGGPGGYYRCCAGECSGWGTNGCSGGFNSTACCRTDDSDFAYSSGHATRHYRCNCSPCSHATATTAGAGGR